MEPARSSDSGSSIPDLLYDAEKDFNSINIYDDTDSMDRNSTLILDSNECLRLNDINAFIRKLGIPDENKTVKVNYRFFGGAHRTMKKWERFIAFRIFPSTMSFMAQLNILTEEKSLPTFRSFRFSEIRAMERVTP